MSFRVLRFGTIVTTTKEFRDAEFKDLTCTVLQIKIVNPDYQEKQSNFVKPKFLIKETPTNPKYASDIMEYIETLHDDPSTNLEWNSNWTLPHAKNI